MKYTVVVLCLLMAGCQSTSGIGGGITQAFAKAREKRDGIYVKVRPSEPLSLPAGVVMMPPQPLYPYYDISPQSPQILHAPKE